MAWLFLPENEQVQYLQKIALRAENPYGPRQYGFAVFSALAAAIEAAHFPAGGTAIDACAAAIFTFFYIPNLLVKWQWELRQKSRPARVVLPSRQIGVHESHDEEDDR